MTHFDAERLEALLCGELPTDEARALVAHLEDGCDACAELLDSEMDLETLLALVDAQEGEDEPPTLAEREAMWEAVAPVPRARRTRWTAGVGAILLLAAAVLFAVFATQPTPAPYEGIKGDHAAVEIALRVLVGADRGDGFQLQGRLQPGAQLRRTDTLLFELETRQAAARYLFAVDGDGEVTPLYADEAPAPPGPWQVTRGSDWVALDLADWTGPVTLVAAAAAEPVPAEQVFSAYKAGKSTAFAFATLRAEVLP